VGHGPRETRTSAASRAQSAAGAGVAASGERRVSSVQRPAAPSAAICRRSRRLELDITVEGPPETISEKAVIAVCDLGLVGQNILKLKHASETIHQRIAGGIPLESRRLFDDSRCGSKHREPAMSAPPFDHDELMRRISRDLIDGYDEELEMEIEDRHPLPDGSSAVLPEAEKDYRRDYFQQLFRLQAELVKLQDWVVASRKKVLILFEGRDAAGKGGAIKRVAQKLNPRVCRTVALPAPNDRERTQWYFQRYVPHLPAAGEIVLFDRSWYNRAGVERVMGFCTPEEYEEFFRSVPEFERMLVRSGITLLKYWFSITDEEQYLRFLGRIHDPLKQWKLSPMDLESRRRWEAYTKAKEIMLERSHIPEARWWVVHAVDKKRARLNFIDHLLKQFPYAETPKPTIVLPQREHHEHYSRQAVPADMVVPEVY
jgi:polyphosphate kinase 2